MKRFTFFVAVVVVTALVGAVRAGEDKKAEPQLRLVVDLADGSHVIGIPSIESIPVQTSYAKMDVPLKEILTIRIAEDHENASLDLKNGDKLKGVVSLGPIKLETLFGKVEVPLTQCRRIAIMTGSADSGLVLHYTFDEDSEKVMDKSGGENDASWVGPPVYEAGVKGKAARFSSKDTYLVAPSPRLNMNGWDGMTVSLWVSLTGYTTYGHVINRGPISTDKPGPIELAIGQGYGRGIFVVQNNAAGGCPPVVAGPGNLPLNQWCHLVGTYDGEMMRYYVDGKLEKETRIAASRTPIADGPDTKLVIGNMSRIPFISWSDMYFNGLVDEVRIYKRALTEEEIRQLGDCPK